jgi:phosphoenolpyruvate-protein kinase (PTS system EI component)
MVETVDAVERAAEIAEIAEFLSIGTNDLTHATLGSDRYAPGRSATHDPRVLAAIDRTARAAAAAGVPLEVCGEAASNAIAMPLLVGLGADELSVGAARVGDVREWVRSLEHAGAGELARRALAARDADAVEKLVRRAALLGEPGDAAAEAVEGGSGVVAVGPEA